MSDPEVPWQSSGTLHAGGVDYRDLINNMPVGAASTTLDGVVLLANQALARMLEFKSGSEIQAQGVLSRWFDTDHYQVFIAKLQQLGTLKNYAIDALTRKGNARRLLVSAVLRDGVIYGMFEDITTRKNAGESQLEEGERKLRKALELAHLGYWEWDIQEDRINWSDGVFRIYGVDRGSPLSYEELRQLIHPEDREYHDRITAAWMENRRAVPYEYRIIRPDGATRHVYATGELECDGAGEPLRFTGIVQDVTEQKLSEHKIQEYQRRLKSLAGELTLAEEKERHNIATELHDHVGQTLAVMRMQLAMARKEGRGRKVEAMLDEVSGLLLEVIQETRNIMSDLSSPAMNELGLAAAIAEWLSVQIGDRFSLVTRFHDDGESRSLSHDTRIILFRSVRELLMNVVKHAHATQVNISIQREHDTVKIIVEDDGTGLDAGSRGAHAAGTGGFGLFSIEERMADLGGSLVIESPPGHGVKAILTAPLSPE